MLMIKASRLLTWGPLLVAVAVLAACSGGSAPSGSTPAGDAGAQPAGDDKAAADPDWNGQTVTVAIRQGSYEPEELSVSRGTKVIWENTDTEVHNVAFPGAENLNFQSPVMGLGQKWEKVFSRTGEFDYVCTLHPFMKAKLKVTE